MTVEVWERFFEAGRKFSKPLEIAAVTFQRVIGEPPLHAQMRQIGVDEIVGG